MCKEHPVCPVGIIEGKSVANLIISSHTRFFFSFLFFFLSSQ